MRDKVGATRDRVGATRMSQEEKWALP